MNIEKVLYEGYLVKTDARGREVFDTSIGDDGVANASTHYPADHPRQRLFRISATDRKGGFAPLLKEAREKTPPMPWATWGHRAAAVACVERTSGPLNEDERRVLATHISRSPCQKLAWNEILINQCVIPVISPRCGQPEFDHGQAVWPFPYNATHGEVGLTGLSVVYQYSKHEGTSLPWGSWQARDHCERICKMVEPEDIYRWNTLRRRDDAPDFEALAERIASDSYMGHEFSVIHHETLEYSRQEEGHPPSRQSDGTLGDILPRP